MMVWRYYTFSCTNCRKAYLRSLSPFQLGTGKRRCQACATVFHDGSREWPELRPMQKFEYVFPTMVLGYFGALMVTVGYAFYVAADSQELGLMLGVLALCMMVPWIPYFLKRRDAIRSSRERFVRRQLLGSSEDVILPV
jgi:hypothetical protein